MTDKVTPHVEVVATAKSSTHLSTYLKITALRGVGNVELNFASDQRAHVLFGTNGVGKTKCLEAIFQFLVFSNKVFLQEGYKSLLRDHVLVMQSADDGDGHSVARPAVEPFFLSHAWKPNAKSAFVDVPIVFLGAARRAEFENQRNSDVTLGTFSERRKKYLASIVEAMSEQQFNNLGMNTDVQAWFVVRAQSANPYQKSTDNRQVEISAVLEILSQIDKRIANDFLEIDGAGRVAIKVDGSVKPLEELSSGFTSLVKLIQAIIAGYGSFTNEKNLRHIRGVVLIDEIESHLHARWQAEIVPRLKTLLPNTTFFIATHSPLVLAQLDDDEAYLLRRDEDGVVRTVSIPSPTKRAFADVLENAFGIDLNGIKRKAIENDDQTEAKERLLQLLSGDGQK